MLCIVHPRRFITLTTFIIGVSASAAAQDKTPESEAEKQARLARKSAGVIVGTWGQIDNPVGGSTTVSDSPIGVGYFRKGIDKHLALETTVGVWRRLVETPASGGIGGTSGGKTTAILLPQFTSLKLFPFTGPEKALEPYASAGAGFTLGFQSQSGSGGVLGGNSGGSGLIVGVGATGGAGVEWRFSNAFGLAAGGHYTYIQFFDNLAGQQMYRGTGANLGLTYRFQY